MILWLVVGVGIGAMIAEAIGNLPAGVALGAAVGLMVAAAFAKRRP
jgi:hypothetical protein